MFCKSMFISVGELPINALAPHTVEYIHQLIALSPAASIKQVRSFLLTLCIVIWSAKAPVSGLFPHSDRWTLSLREIQSHGDELIDLTMELTQRTD